MSHLGDFDISLERLIIENNGRGFLFLLQETYSIFLHEARLFSDIHCVEDELG